MSAALRVAVAFVALAAALPGQVLDAGSATRAARDERRAGHVDAALATLDRARPADDPRVVGERIQALLDAGRPVEAVELAEAHEGPVRTLPMVVAHLRLAALLGRHDDVLAAVDHNLVAAPHHADLHALRVSTLAALGRDAEAADALLALPDSVPPHQRRLVEIDVHHLRGRRELEDPDLVERAVPRLEHALSLDTERIDVRVDLARALVRFNRNERAEEVVLEGLARDDLTDAERLALVTVHGDVCRSMDRLDDARDAFAEVLAGRPDDVDARVGLARCDLRGGDFDAATDALDAVLADVPDHFEAHLVRTEVALLAADGDAAEQHIRAVLDTRPRHLKAQYMLSRALLLQGRAAEAREVLAEYRARQDALASR